jgi:hypothetical protein
VLPSLRSLDVCEPELRNAQFLQGYTQLQKLKLRYTNLESIGVISQLTSLTSLTILPATYSRQVFSTSEQSELGSALGALSKLRWLFVHHAPPGPVTEALSQLTALTWLCLMHQELVLNPGPLDVPSVLSLTFGRLALTAKYLVCIDAPQLQHLTVFLAVQPSDLPDLKGYAGECSQLAAYCSSTCSRLGPRRTQSP